MDRVKSFVENLGFWTKKGSILTINFTPVSRILLSIKKEAGYLIFLPQNYIEVCKMYPIKSRIIFLMDAFFFSLF